MALLLAVQLLCVISGAFAAEHTDDDIHHTLVFSDAAFSDPAFSDTVSTADIHLLADNSNHAACDHCSHCHAAHHIGLYKTSAVLPLVSGERPVFLQEPVPATPNLSIYRPPIA